MHHELLEGVICISVCRLTVPTAKYESSMSGKLPGHLKYDLARRDRAAAIISSASNLPNSYQQRH